MRSRPWIAVSFLLPALLLLGALVVYPIVYSVFRSLFDASGVGFVGLGNYVEVFTDDDILTAFKNNLIWVIVAPTVCTALGLIFAVLTERVRWGTAFKLIVFMPMAISMLAAGIIFRLVYEQDPEQGVANAVWVGVHDTFAESSAFPGAQPAARRGRWPSPAAAASPPRRPSRAAIRPTCRWSASRRRTPADAAPAEGRTGRPGGRGHRHRLAGLHPGRRRQAGRHRPAGEGARRHQGRGGQGRQGRRVGRRPAADGTFTLPAPADGAQLRLPASNFAEPYNGVDWLGPSLVTPPSSARTSGCGRASRWC